MADGSAEAEQDAPTAAYKVGKHFQLLVQKALAGDLLLNLRRDNQAKMAMLENLSWQTIRLSIEHVW